MGIYDRDYTRHTAVQRATRRQPTRVLSVTGWIIAVCAAVFFLKAIAPKVPVVMNTAFLRGVSPTEVQNIRATEFRYSDVKWSIDPNTLQPNPRPEAQYFGVRQVALGDKVIAIQAMRKDALTDAWGSFSTAKALIWHDPLLGWGGLQVWRFITFQFLHASVDHIVMNMIALFFFGGMVEQYLGGKRYLAFYLLCGSCGALMYLLLNGLGLAGQALFGPTFAVPGLLFENPNLPLVGASAGVLGVIMACAYLAPNAEVMLFFLIPMRLRVLAYGLVVLAIVSIFFYTQNAGGEAAHLGGALAGFYFIRNPHHLHGMFDFAGRFDPTSRVAKARAAARRGVAGSEIDRILAKIHATGLHSLTEEEKRALREASRR